MPETPNHQSNEEQNAALAQTATAAGSDSLPPGVGPSLSKGEGLGRYTILETLGAGGMGVVYGAYDPDLDRKVALKLLRGREGSLGSTTNADRARLLREARAMAKLSCPNVITVFEVGTVAERDFVAMEFIDGQTLAEWMKQPRDWSEVVEIFRLAGDGLASAHDGGLIHRDFKPANVLLRHDGRVVVTDFGLARLSDEMGEVVPVVAAGSGISGSDSEPLTRTGAILGTPAYMAPEQHKGQPADERSDQFSFSVALYEGLYGERPFKGKTFDDLKEATLAGEIPPEPKGSSVPAWLRAVMLRGLSADPQDRYPSMAEMLRALTTDPRVKRRWIMGIAAAVAVVAVVGVLLARRGGKGDDFERGKRAAQAQQCADTERNFAGVWDADKKRLLKSAFIKASADAATATYAGFVRVIDRYKQEWGRIYKNTCEATRVERTRSEEDFHLHMGCLLERRNQLKSLVQVFMGADSRVADRAVQAAQDLPRVADCGDLTLLRSGLAPPKNPKVRQAVEQVRALLSEARALQQALRLKAGIAMAAKAVELAKKSGYKPVEAEALYRLGRLYAMAEETKEARQSLKEAGFAAQLSDHKDYQARVAVAQVQLEARFSSRNAATRKKAQLALAMVERQARDKTLKARLDSALGRLAIDDADFVEAKRRFDSAYNTLRKELGADHLRTVGLLHRLAEVAQATGKTGQALALHQDALAALQKQLGKEHPRAAAGMESVASLLRVTGRFDEARALFKRAKAYWASEAGQRAMASFGLTKPTVKAPRTVSGRVVDGAGKPVANAEVAMGSHLNGDGKYMYAAYPRGYERMMPSYRTTSGPDGRFEFKGVESAPMYIAAETDAGRSWPALVKKTGAVTKLRLSLRQYGRLEGSVSLSGKRPPEFTVFATAEGSGTVPRSGVWVAVGPDNRYAFQRLAAGTYLLFVEAGGATQGRMYTARKVKIEPGKLNKFDLSLAVSGAQLQVDVVGEPGKDIGTLQLAVFEGHVVAKTLSAVRKAFAGAVSRSNTRVGNTKPVGTSHLQRHAFRAMPPGNYTVCAVILGGDIKNPQFARTLKKFDIEVPVQCDPITIGTQAVQKVTMKLRKNTKSK